MQTSSVSRDAAAEELLSRLGDTENYPHEHLAPYKEFRIGANTYYFTPGGFLYRKDPDRTRWGAISVATSPTRFGTTGPTTGRAGGSLARGRIDWYSPNLGQGFIVLQDDEARKPSCAARTSRLR